MHFFHLFITTIVLFSNLFSQQIDFSNHNRIYLPQGKSNEMKFFSSNEITKNINFLNSSQNIQLDSGVKIDSIKAFYSSGTIERRLFQYNNDKIKSFVIQYYYDNQWNNDWKITNEYDSLSQQTSSLTETPNSDNIWEPLTVETFLYDRFGNNTEYLIEFYNIDYWENSMRTTYDYDEDGNLAYSHTENWDGSNWILSLMYTFYYFENGLKDTQSLELWENNSWQNYWLYNFNYDEDWRIMEILTLKWDGVKWNDNGRITFDYSVNERTELFEMWEGNSWNGISRMNYTLNSSNFIISCINENNYNGEWIIDDGALFVDNPDGFFQAFLSSEVLVYYDPTTDLKKENNNAISTFELSQNYPNPFNPSTVIKYSIPRSTEYHSVQQVILKVYDMLGRVIAVLVNKEQSAGSYVVNFDASTSSATAGGLTSGVYFYTLQSGGFIESKKMVLIR